MLPTLTKEKWKRVAITLFIVLHVYIMAFWGLPGSNFRYLCTRPIERYVVGTGLWHSWDMFSPDPLLFNFDVEAELTYSDGSTKVWQFPRMERLGYWERFQKERYRKWRERVRLDAYSVVWNDTARYIARLNDTPGRHPVRVTLVRRWQPIPAPAQVPGTPHFTQFQPMISEPVFTYNYRFHTYEVKPGDL